jgi:DNA repair exonuclease SbcCD ATPase subunit
MPGAEVLVQPFSFAEVAVRSLTLVCRHDLSNQPNTIPVDPAEPESNLAAGIDPAQANTVTAFSTELPLPPQEETKDIPMKTSEEVLEEVVTPQARGIKPAATKDPAGRCRELEEELSGMGHLCGELLAKYTAEQQTAAEAAQRGAELEEQLAERNRELEKIKTELERLTTESQRLETENRALQDGKKAVETEFVAIQAKAGPRDTELADLQQRFDEAASGRARLSADLERERAERRRIEQRAAALATQLQEMHARTGQHLEAERLSQERISALEKQLREREDALARATADLEKESAERNSAEEQLRAAGALIAQLQHSVSSFDGARKAMQRRHDDLEKQLQSSTAAAAESAARADKDARECERLEKALSAAESARQQQATEVSKLQCALEVEQAEKNRLEGEAAQLRYSTADSARAGLTTLNRLRSETRAPVGNLMQATRQLLEVELPDETRALVTSVLDNALLLQSKLHENGAPKGGTAAPESTASAAATPSVA